MPNWVRNVITFECYGKTLYEIQQAIKRGDRVFDFNTLIPMPESLNIECGSTTDVAVDCFLYGTDEIEKDILMRKYDLTAARFDEMYEKGRTYICNRMQYGHMTWYTWCIEKWGTKWNTSFAFWEDNRLIFDTAWSTPVPILEALSAKFPNVPFTVEYADENFGNNCGIINYEGGHGSEVEGGYGAEVSSFASEDEAIQFAKNLWDEEDEDEGD